MRRGHWRNEAIVWALVAAGVLLRARQLTGGVSLWLDEIAVTRNIVTRGYGALLAPLEYGQVAPVGFLWAERWLWSLAGTDWSLRIFPFACSIASLFFMRALARRTLEGIAVPLAVGAFALGVPYTLYCCQVKQYSSDIAVALGILVLAAALLQEPSPTRRRSIVAGVAGAIAMWFSNSAVLLAAGVGAALLLHAWRAAKQGNAAHARRVTLCVLLPWGVSAAAAVLVARHGVSGETMEYMQQFWRSAFPPLRPRSMKELRWPWDALRSLFGTPWGLRYRYGSVYVVLALCGFAVVWRRNREVALLLAAPVLVTAGAAAARLYPFEGRLVFFLNPILLITTAAAIGFAAAWIGARSRLASAALVLLVIAPPLERIFRLRPPYRIQQTEELLERLVARRLPGDAVYVWYRAWPNLAWYGPRHGLATDALVHGGCWIAEPRRFLTELDAMRGRARVWIIISGSGFPEARLLKNYANEIGVAREHVEIDASVTGYFPLEMSLYDFSDRVRLARARADSYPVSLPAPWDAAVTACTTGPWAG